jgi:uncharacterized protein YhbP (UPF0306 family)
MKRDIISLVLAYMQDHQVMTLATVGPDGVWAAAVFYAHDGFAFYFLSAAHTRHVQNIRQNPRVAATIQEDYKDWSDIKGIQLEGNVAYLSDNERQDAISLYQQRFPFVGGGNGRSQTQIQAALDRVDWYRLVPERMYFIDNSLGLGHRDEVPL